MNICDYLTNEKGIILSDQQRAAVEAPAGQLLLLAVPGAGKTTVVTARAAHLIHQQGVAAQRLLALTYNRSAARDMQRRYGHFFDSLPGEAPAFSTIHSFCYRLLGEYARMRGTTPPRMLEGEEGGGKGRIVSGIYRQMTGQFLPEDQLNRMLNLMGYCINMQCQPEEALNGRDADLAIFPQLMREYTAWKRQQNQMDFDDMLLFSYTALCRVQPLRERVAARYDHLLVDEAQDTSKLQQEIIALLSRDNLFLVGDEDQSIYGFRGSYPQGLLAFFQRYPQGQLLKLEQNYRSTPEIVSASEQLITQNTGRYHKSIFTQRQKGKAVGVITRLPMEQQYRAIAEEAAAAIGQGSCAVLYRTSFSGIGVAIELAQLGVPYSASQSQLGYSSDFITRDVLNLLRLAKNPGDEAAFRQVYFRLGCGISREAAQRALQSQSSDILETLIAEAGEKDRSTGRLLFARRILARLSKKPPATQIDDIMEELGYLDSLEKRGPSGYMMSSYLQRLAIIRRLARDCSSTEDLLERLPQAESFLDAREWKGVRLSTVHSAKGQEYDHVIVADALEGIFPAADVVEYSSLGQKEPMEEETRLFYVAMTRARNSLTVYAPEEGFGRELLQSRFVAMAGLSTVVAVGAVRVGVDVAHTFFGAGQVVELNTARQLVTVDFRHYGRKSFGLETLRDPKLFKLLQ